MMKITKSILKRIASQAGITIANFDSGRNPTLEQLATFAAGIIAEYQVQVLEDSKKSPVTRSINC